MKKIYLLLCIALISCSVFAQAPQSMSYQAIIRNSSNALLINTQVGIKITILKGSPADNFIAYSETQSAMTNQNGLVSLQIGGGTTTGVFSAIDWSTGTYFIKTETDPTGGSNYTITGTSQLMSVPYALYAKTSGSCPVPTPGLGMVLNDNRQANYIDFASAAGFGVYTSAGAIANTGTTTITGNVGSNAGAITGFAAPSLIIGGINIANASTISAAKDLSAAYMQLTTRVPTSPAHPLTVFGNGETLFPGVYSVTAALSVNGLLILDGQNKPDAQFIIKTGGAFTTAAGSIVALTNGANAENVFWVAEGAVAIGANTTMTGVVIANNAAISVAAGGTLNGRLYSTAGAIAISNTNAVGLKYIVPIRIMPNADIVIKRNVTIGSNLNVDSSVTLNTVSGSTTNYGAFTVERNSTTLLTGQLFVNGSTRLKNTLITDGATTLGNTLDVTAATHLKSTLLTDAATTLSSTLDVTAATHLKSTLLTDGATTLGNTLDVTGATHLKSTLLTDAATMLSSTLDVTGATHLKNTLLADAATILSSTLAVTGKSIFRDSVTFNKAIGITGVLSSSNLLISGSDPSFLAKIENTDGDTGDGLIIKLGKTHPAWDGSAYANMTSPAEVFDGAISTIRGWVIDHNSFDPKQLLTFIPTAYVAGLACNLVNVITPKLNEKLSLPLVFPKLDIPEIDMPALEVPGFTIHTPSPLPNIDFPAVPIIGRTTLFPATTLIHETTLIPTIPQVDCSSLPSLTIPNISFTDVTNSLSNKNQFISFKDKDDRELGSIRAESVVEWGFNYLDGNYFVNLMASIVGIDVVSGIANVIAGFTDIAGAYNSIGVEYASGHGDYAEWLERSDATEIISAGDIVAVKAGKVSKDLRGAEQILVVSHNPIVLGNAPTASREQYGNKIAFMGQVPVKVTGPVASGDYIIAKGESIGYGVAVHADKMTDSDYKLSIGRSWESNLNDGPKMVNTLIGVDNGNYFSILKKSKEQTTILEAKTIILEKRMKALESNMNSLLHASSSTKRHTSKLVRNTLK